MDEVGSIGLTLAQTVGSGSGSVDTTIFLFVVGGLCTAISTLATILWRRVERENADCRTQIVDLQARLAKYEDLAPDLIAAVEASRSLRYHEPTSVTRGTRARRIIRVSYPYRSPHPSSRGARKPPT